MLQHPLKIWEQFKIKLIFKNLIMYFRNQNIRLTFLASSHNHIIHNMKAICLSFLFDYSCHIGRYASEQYLKVMSLRNREKIQQSADSGLQRWIWASSWSYTVHQSPIRNDISGRVSIYVCTMLNRPLHLFPILLEKYEEAWEACDLCWEWCMESFLKQ